jgi:hypothetical protein
MAEAPRSVDETLDQQGASIRPPGALAIDEQCLERRLDAREVCRQDVERCQAVVEPLDRFGRRELRCKRADGAVFDAQCAPRVAPRRQQQQRAPPGAAKASFVQTDVVPGEKRERWVGLGELASREL